jgi:hypothetical protein
MTCMRGRRYFFLSFFLTLTKRFRSWFGYVDWVRYLLTCLTSDLGPACICSSQLRGETLDSYCHDVPLRAYIHTYTYSVITASFLTRYSLLCCIWTAAVLFGIDHLSVVSLPAFLGVAVAQYDRQEECPSHTT